MEHADQVIFPIQLCFLVTSMARNPTAPILLDTNTKLTMSPIRVRKVSLDLKEGTNHRQLKGTAWIAVVSPEIKGNPTAHAFPPKSESAKTQTPPL